MKLLMQDGVLYAKAESIQDVQTLMCLPKGSRLELPNRKGKHKKHLWQKICPICGKSNKGKKGLGKHWSSKHKKEITLPDLYAKMGKSDSDDTPLEDNILDE